ncbi:hypothetical protein LSH36_814g03039, partial [Paralvinella palmiformis]
MLEGDNGFLKSDGYILPDLLFGDPSIDMPLPRVLKSCDANKPAMEALELYRKFNLDDMLDWRQHVDIDSEINKLDIDLSDVNIITNDTKNQLNDFKDAVMIDYKGFVDELTKNTTKVDLATYESLLKQLNDSYPDAGEKLLADIKTLNASSQTIPVARTFQVRIEGIIDSFVGYANLS